MLLQLVVCNILAGLAVALAFRAMAIVVAAPIMAAWTIVMLVGGGYGIGGTLLGTALCLALGQFAFLIASMLATRPSAGWADAQAQKLGKRFEN